MREEKTGTERREERGREGGREGGKGSTTQHDPECLSSSVPTFSNFTHTPPLAGSVTASWVLATPGVRPLEQVVVRWVEEASIEVGDDPLADSSLYPLENIVIMNYDVTNPDEVLKSGHVFTLTFEDLVAGETYSVAVTGTSILGSKTTLFRIQTGNNEKC